MVLPDECGPLIHWVSLVYAGVIGQKNLVLCRGMKRRRMNRKRHFRMTSDEINRAAQ